MSGRIAAGIVMLGLFTFVGGCESTELEQRGFPLAMGVDLQAEPEELAEEPKANEEQLIVSFDFPDLKQVSDKSKTADTPVGLSIEGADLYHVEKAYENNTNRVLDYNHLKAVILGERILADSQQIRALLQAWEQQQGAARNTCLFIGVPGAADILKLTEETEGSVGKYLEEMMESRKDFKQNKIVTAGNLMNQWHNQDELLLVPAISEVGKRPSITGYGVIANFQYRGMITVEEAMQAFMAQGLLEKFTYGQEQNQAVEISNIKIEKKVTQENGFPVITLDISGEGRMKTGQPGSLTEQLRIEKGMEEQIAFDLTKTAQSLAEKYGIDMTNSYRALGGYHREMYNQYQDLPDTYAKELKQVFRVDITLLNWK